MTDAAAAITRRGRVLALAEMFTCGPGDSALIAVDSALNLGEMRPHQLADLADAMVPHRRPLLALCDGRSQSGLEPLVRLFLIRQRIRVRTRSGWPASAGECRMRGPGVAGRGRARRGILHSRADVGASALPRCPVAAAAAARGGA